MPEVLAEKGLDHFEQMLADQGKMVEKEFYKLSPDTCFVLSKGIDAVAETKSLLQSGFTHIAQAAFEAGGFFAQSDLIHVKEDGHLDLYEVKSSSSMQNMDVDGGKQAPNKEEHEKDLAFQYEVATRAGYIIDTTFLVELNKNFTRHGHTDPAQLFSIHPVTENVMKLLPGIREKMQEALSFTGITTPPITCGCMDKPRKKQCPAFAYLYPDRMGYSIYDLPRISETRLREFNDQNIFRIEDIPVNNKLTDIQRDHVQSWNENREIIHRDKIETTLGGLGFPLYFLDYETYASAIPVFDGTRPYQHVPFQYSLHILDGPGADIRHKEYLHIDTSNPMVSISQSLRAAIQDHGTIIVWHKSFEGGRNKELAYAVPPLAEFLLSLNNRMFDLKDIFSQRMYVHKDFHGCNSIKDVLPVLVPSLSYKELTIQNGGHATSEWGRMVFEVTDEAEKQVIRDQLLEYCKLDTLAMVEIYKKVLEKIRDQT